VYDRSEKKLIDNINITTSYKEYLVKIPAFNADILKIQIDQNDKWQFLSLKNIKLYLQNEKELKINNKNNFVSFENKYLSNKCSRNKIEISNKILPINFPERLNEIESRFYFYQAIKAIKRKIESRNQEVIIFLMPDTQTDVLMPAIKRLRCEGIKIIAYENSVKYPTGVNDGFYWNHADSHWTELAAELTAEEIKRMWIDNDSTNQSYSDELIIKLINNNN
jgi:hypothetical protein